MEGGPALQEGDFFGEWGRYCEHGVALPLYQADQQRSHLLHQALQQLIDEELLKTEASRKGVTVSQLVADASQSEAIARLANLPAPVKQLSPGKARGSVALEAPRDPQEQARLLQALLVALRRQATIHINLPAPEPPILPVSADDNPSVGPANAPITIVEFSDFQCPYCKLSVPLIKEILAKYPGKVRVVYQDYPGPNHLIHMRYKPPRPPSAQETKESFGNTTTACSTAKPRGQDGTFPNWLKRSGLTRTSLPHA